MVFYGPSGTGKTTVANIIAQQSGRTLRRLNATTASLADIRSTAGSRSSAVSILNSKTVERDRIALKMVK